jgi:hypothetical protein
MFYNKQKINTNYNGLIIRNKFKMILNFKLYGINSVEIKYQQRNKYKLIFRNSKQLFIINKIYKDSKEM